MSDPDRHDPYEALRLRDYRCLLSGGVLASIGLGVQTVAVGWEMSQRIEDANEASFVIGLTGLAQFLPVLLLALPAGQVADRVSRKYLFQLAQGMLALLAVTLAILSLINAPIWVFLLSLLFVGVARAFSTPARVSLLPQVVPASVLPNAVTWNSTGWHIANVGGPALGGLAIAWWNSPTAYAIAAGCALTCVLLLILVRPQVAARRSEPASLRNLVAGVAFVWRTRLLLAAITLDLFAVLLGGATALLPIYARDILRVEGLPPGVVLGWLRAAPSAGAVLMAIVLAHSPPLKRAGVALLGSVAIFGIATIVFGLSESFWLSLAVLAIAGAFDNVSVVVRGTLMQTLTPDAMRGRVAAVNFVFVSSSNELGEFESGLAAYWLGPVRSVVYGGWGTILVVLLVALNCPPLRRLGHLHKIKALTTEKTEAASPG